LHATGQQVTQPVTLLARAYRSETARSA
jgi:hypothetical protein